jgi:hypothetical protein
MNNMQGAAEQVGGVVQEIQKRTVSSFFKKNCSLDFRKTKKSLFSPISNSSSFSLHLVLFSVLLSHPCG